MWVNWRSAVNLMVSLTAEQFAGVIPRIGREELGSVPFAPDQADDYYKKDLYSDHIRVVYVYL